MSRVPSPQDLERLVDGEFDAEQAAAFRAHIADSETCAAELRALEDLNRALRSERNEVSAPQELRDRVQQILRGQVAAGIPGPPAGSKSVLTRRNIGIAAFGALAAGLAGVVVLPRLLPSRLGTNDIAATLIRDFETFLSAERVLDFTEGDPAAAVAWYQDRLAFDLPRLPADLDGFRLRGGRLCWLLDRRLASLSFETSQDSLALYIMPSEGTVLAQDGLAGPPRPKAGLHRQGRFTNVIWRQDDLVLALVGEVTPGRVQGIARLISRAGPE